MKKFNVPTQMDVILKLITGKNRKPHFRCIGDTWCALFGVSGAGIGVCYRKGHIVVSVHHTVKGRVHGKTYMGFAECHAWAKRVDSNRHKWDK